MGVIHVLDTQSANMIAAGEVVDRPASAVKELVENAVDAGAKNITIDIRAGGNASLRISDDGCGIAREDLPTALLRHATSKISTGEDLFGVRSLGFRGEALAAISAVSRLEIISKQRGSVFGSRLSSDENGVELYEAGCPDGTSIVVNNIFYNVPARRKFLKKDVTEGAACVAVCEKLALSHPEISFTVLTDGSTKFRTSGDGKLYSALYDIYGAATARTLIPVDGNQDGIAVTGYISRPDAPRGSRNMQSFFINGRYVRSKTVQAAVEEAYRSYIPSGKFPAAFLCLTVDYHAVDVNVHPAKTEIKFSDERAVFGAVYYAVRNTLTGKPAPKEAASGKTDAPQVTFTEPKAASTSSDCPPVPKPSVSEGQVISGKPMPSFSAPKPAHSVFTPNSADSELSPLRINPSPDVIVRSPEPETVPAQAENDTQVSLPVQGTQGTQEQISPVPEFRYIGEAYRTYLFAETKDGIFILDKHAAHERMLYEELKNKKTVSVQELLTPVTVTLSRAETETLLGDAPLLAEYGFVLEGFGDDTIVVRGVPSSLKNLASLQNLLEGFAQDLASSAALPFAEKCDRALYTMACKAAFRAGDTSDPLENERIIRGIFEKNLRYCPHGRPFLKLLSKKELERYFDR